MTDRSPLDDSLVTFDQQPSSSPSVTTPTKSKDLYDNRSLEDVDPFGNHQHGNGTNGQEYHSNNGTTHDADDHHHGTNGSNDGGLKQFSSNNEHFPVETNEHENGNSTLSTRNIRQILIVLFQFRLILRPTRNIRHEKMKNRKIHRGITVAMSTAGVALQIEVRSCSISIPMLLIRILLKRTHHRLNHHRSSRCTTHRHQPYLMAMMFRTIRQPRTQSNTNSQQRLPIPLTLLVRHHRTKTEQHSHRLITRIWHHLSRTKIFPLRVRNSTKISIHLLRKKSIHQ